MRLKTLELHGFKSFAQKTILEFKHPIVAIVGPNGSGKSNVVEAFRFVLGEQSMKSMRGKTGHDLIFKGSKSLSRAGRASATVFLDNQDRVFKLSGDTGEDLNLNYDAISISREVYPDGLSKYILNKSEVRLKDIVNLLSSVNIGASGHHIISQGEADRILNANPRERREMVEDTLGLKIYQYKIRESERKLERTEENMKEVTMLRRENAPHLNFLKKQMEKIEKADEMRQELARLYQNYLKGESFYLGREKASLADEKNKIEKELESLTAKISKETQAEGKEEKKLSELKILDQKSAQLRALKSELERKLGRIEGIIEIKENKVKFSDICPVCGSRILSTSPEQIKKREEEEKELKELKNSRAGVIAETAKIEEEEKDNARLTEKLKEEFNREISVLRSQEKEKYAHKLREQELTSTLQVIKVKEESLRKEEEAFQNELREGEVLVGPAILSYKTAPAPEEVDRAGQEGARKKIERIKIKLEDVGGGSSELRKEFEEMSERDKFLEKEMEDLKQSIESLKALIADLKEKIGLEFKEGLEKINIEFKEFFSVMFGGGNASLSLSRPEPRRKKDEELEEEIMEESEEEIPEEGIEINVSLPQKKVKALNALSGGERSLVSIALLFAMSQVNPPPFLVLDETDAALDESNSRKFGDMLEKLSKESQLVLVTHNRETMSRAGVLYGVTIGSDGASKLLSVKLSEAEAIAE